MIVALSEPEVDGVAAKVLDPQPDFEIPAKVAKLNLGNATMSVSETNSGVFTEKAILIDDGVAVIGDAITRSEDRKAVGSSVETAMAVTGRFAVAPARGANSIVLEGELAA